MKIKGIIEEDFVNYKKPSMYVAFPKCSFKCGRADCQNSALAKEKDIEVSASYIIQAYLDNPIPSAIVCCGLEPFDSWEDLKDLIIKMRQHNDDDIVIYTGYTEEELRDKVKWLSKYKNIIVKFGRFVPNQEKHFDGVLGVWLSSSNQYAKRISDLQETEE